MIYYINIVMMVLLRYSMRGHFKANDQYEHKKNRKLFCIICSVAWILISGLRNVSVGADTLAYERKFYEVANMSWASLWNNIVYYISSGQIFTETTDFKDVGLYVFNKIIQVFFPTYQGYLFVVAVIFMVALGRFIYKNSRDPFISFLLFDCLFYSFYAITGTRQTVATAIVVLFGYEAIKERKLLKFSALMLLALLVHKSAICFFPFYFLYEKKITKKYLGIMAGIIAISFVFRYQLIVFLGGLVGYSRYAVQYDTSGPITFTFLLIMVFALTAIKKDEIIRINPNEPGIINALILSLCFLPLAFIDPSAMRVTYYFAIFLMLLLPDLVDAMNRKYYQLIYFGLSLVMILLLIRNNPQYAFFWQ